MRDDFQCQYGGTCGGCPLIGSPYEDQKTQKNLTLQRALKNAGITNPEVNIEWVHISLGGLRDKVDMVFEGGSAGTNSSLGFYSLDRHQLIDIEACPQMSPGLQKYYTHFRKLKFPIKKGSVRLRVGSDGQFGVWLDFANIDIKNLMDDGTVLRQLLKIAVVEVGQRRKILKEIEGQLRLTDPEIRPWFQTLMPKGSEFNPISLNCSIGDFTQPSMRANHELVKAVLAPILKLPNPDQLCGVEFGPGSGNFTLPLAQICKTLEVFEYEQRACDTLAENLAIHGLSEKVKIHQGNFHQPAKSQEFSWEEVDFAIVDPPRSGLQGFLDSLLGRAQKPRYFIYVSCFAESFAADAAKLLNSGYQLSSLKIVDQFPQSHHFEIVAYFVQV